MQLTDFNYVLPDSAVAIHPPKLRGSTKLLVLNRQTGTIKDSLYKNLASFLRPGDLLVINNTKVIPARLLAQTENGDNRELLLLEKHGSDPDHHKSMVIYRRKIRPGQQLSIGEVTINVEEVYDNGTAKISSDYDLWELADKSGEIPLPPYLNRHAGIADRERYQTEFAKEKGSVAAPTASLNLTTKLLDKLKSKGVGIAELTLHVGLGTFLPIRAEDVTKHKMHEEYFEIPRATVMAIRETKQRGGRVIAVGTTVTRTLEDAAIHILNPQINRTLSGEADIFIYPGYQFEIVDGMVTNFHAPASTVLMMAAAFGGWENLKKSYEHALDARYKFLSYGDSMLII